jgi:polysaccharide deacetylase 2 family uncharacterized protein YibQ
VPHFFPKDRDPIGISLNLRLDRNARIFRRGACPVFLVVSAAFLGLAGCTKKPVARNEPRMVTTEIVTAARKVTSNKAQIVVRPQIQTLQRGSSGAVDDIYVSLPSPSQRAALDQALALIAGRHGLAMTTSVASAGVTRFDFSLNGNRTHTVHVVIPLSGAEALAQKKNPAKPETARLAIIIDDLGYDRRAADAVLALPFPLTVSVLPHLSISSEVAEEAYSRGDQVLLHLPMESDATTTPSERIELRVGMSAAQVSSAVSGMLETVPYVVGVNNHQGSRATSDSQLMQALMPVLRQHGLFFIDSRTDRKTVAYQTAKLAGVRAASRKVFLDDTATRGAIIAQLRLAGRDAVRDGFTIAIGHPRPETIAALAEEVPRLEAGGIRLVFASDVVN